MDTWRVVSVGVALAGVYLYLLNKRLHAMRYKPETPIPSDEEILRSTEDWRAKGPLDGSGVEHATGKRYTVIGGCGAVGIVFVQTLHGRGERNIVVIDLSPLPPALASLEGVSAIKTDISSLESVREAFASAKPDVVFHLAAAVRFYERLAYTLPWSARINADGTKNVLDALAELDDSSEKIYVYCSSASLPSATSSFFLLGLDGGTSTNPVYKDGDCAPGTTPLSHNYPITKAQAEAFVVQANGKNGLKAGVLRPGMAIQSPGDLDIAAVVRTKGPAQFVDSSQIHTCIDSRDVCLAHLLYERALRERPQEVAGDAFLVTGDQRPYSFAEKRHVINLFAKRKVDWQGIPILPLFLFSHLIEAYLYVRWHVAGAIGVKVAPVPAWMVLQNIHMLQPSLYQSQCIDVIIDDTRARKVLGYCPRYTTPETIRWIVDTVENESLVKIPQEKATPLVRDTQA